MTAEWWANTAIAAGMIITPASIGWAWKIQTDITKLKTQREEEDKRWDKLDNRLDRLEDKIDGLGRK